MNIFSKIEQTTTLHIIHRKKDFEPGRIDIVQPDHFIQCAAMQMNNGQTFKPHRHLMQFRSEAYIPQESWVVISGMVQVFYYDLDNGLIHTDVLEAGDISITLEGGHNYRVMSDNTLVYEFKTGPYKGQLKDKVFI